MIMMRFLIAAAVASGIIFGAPTVVARASTPTPSSTTVADSPTPGFLDVNYKEPATFSWPAVRGAVQYRLSGSVHAVRGNASDPILRGAARV